MKSRRASIILLTLSLIGINIAAAQQPKHKSQGRLNASKPTVYLSFQQRIFPTTEGKEELQLSLHNNTRWNIIYYLAPEIARPGTVPVVYKVEDDKRSQVFINLTGDVVFQEKLAPGKSISFVVAREHLNHGYQVYVEFNYEWEIRDHISPYSSEPNHRVYFGWYDMPKSLNQ